MLTDVKLNVWKTLKLGTGLRTAEDFKKAIADANMYVTESADCILDGSAFKVSDTEQEVDLALVTAIELGFKDGARYDQICAKAQELGLELCPAEVGPQLCLQYTDQPVNEGTHVAMEVFVLGDKTPLVFSFQRGTYLHTQSVPKFWVFCNTMFVFIRPRK